MELQVDTTRSHHGWTVVEASGEIDVYTSPRLREKLVEVFDGGARDVVVSLEHVDFIDSTGLGVLIGALKRANKVRGRLAIVCDKPQFSKLLRITGLDRIFTIYARLDALPAEPALSDHAAAG